MKKILAGLIIVIAVGFFVFRQQTARAAALPDWAALCTSNYLKDPLDNNIGTVSFGSRFKAKVVFTNLGSVHREWTRHAMPS